MDVVIILQLGNAEAQDLEPRKYVNAPVGQNFLRVAFGHSEGDVSTSPSLPLDDANLSMNTMSLAYFRTTSLRGEGRVV